MLLQFNFKNFKSFRDEATLDMTAASVSEYPEHVISMGGERVLPVAAIYGPNASGKSNVCEAFEYMRHMVLMSFRLSGTNARSAICDSFSFGDRCVGGSSFEVFFADSGNPKERIFNYGFCIDRDGEIVEEWLNVRAKTGKESKCVFSRNEARGERMLDLSGVDRAFRRNIEVSLGKDALLLSLGNSLQVPGLKTVYDWFSRCSSLSFGRSTRNQKRTFERWFRRNQDKEGEVLKYLATFDDSISNIEVVEYEEPGFSEEVPERTVSDVIAFHKAGGGIALSLESDGTLQMLDLYPTLSSAFERGGIVVADELGAHLHPLLLRNIVLSFLNPEVNKGHAQLVFTTHDVWLLFTGLLRRDEVWFTEKDSEGVSSLYSLADFEDEGGKKIRKDESFGKNYLLGKYGAIPSLSQIGCFS
jgi:AAA15 family ATPase/GTPase